MNQDFHLVLDEVSNPPPFDRESSSLPTRPDFRPTRLITFTGIYYNKVFFCRQVTMMTTTKQRTTTAFSSWKTRKRICRRIGRLSFLPTVERIRPARIETTMKWIGLLCVRVRHPMESRFCFRVCRIKTNSTRFSNIRYTHCHICTVVCD